MWFSICQVRGLVVLIRKEYCALLANIMDNKGPGKKEAAKMGP